MSISLIIIMGVSGSGKSTIARALAQELEYQFIEADDFHPACNVEYMSQGKPLTNAMREPWINALLEEIKHANQQQKNCVMSYSGLYYKHRIRFKKLPLDTTFIHLNGSYTLIKQRMDKRNHFMSSDLLESQFNSLEECQKDEIIHSINIDQSITGIIDNIKNIIRQ